MRIAAEKLLNSARTKPVGCPYCGHQVNAHTAHYVEDAPVPAPGDFTICVKCAHISRFTDTLELRSVTNEEMIDYKNQEPESHKQILEVQTFFYKRLRENKGEFKLL